jgi:hypothetical protein
MMQVLGSYMIGRYEQRDLVDGCPMELPRDRIIARILARASIGDLIWLKEPWSLVTSREHGPQNISAAIPGPVGTRPPAHLAKIIHKLRQQPRSALVLDRADSRITLEIMCIGEHSVRALVHFQQIDDFLKSRQAVA